MNRLKLIALLALSLTSALANADQVIAQVTVSGGLLPPGGFSMTTINVRDSGVVERSYNRGGFVEVLRLSDAKVKELETYIAQVKPGRLVAAEDRAGCLDAPSTTYSVIRHGKAIQVGANIQCIDRHLENGTGYAIVSDLEAIERLAR